MPTLISIHAPRKGERPPRALSAGLNFCISIHAPRKGERRGGQSLRKLIDTDFNPRSPQGGATVSLRATRSPRAFQSTLPARGSDSGGFCRRRGDL